MRTSIYVQDELWNRAVRVAPGLGPSQLVQTSLQYLVEAKEPRRTFTAPPGVSSEMHRREVEEVTAELRAQAQSSYNSGFYAGSWVARHIGWEALDRLPDYNWDFDTWRRELAAEYKENPVAEVGVFEGDGEEADIEANQNWSPSARLEYALSVQDFYPLTPVVRQGLTDALRAIWTAVVEKAEPSYQSNEPVLATANAAATDVSETEAMASGEAKELQRLE